MKENTLPTRRKRLVALALAVAVLVALGSASAGAFGSDKSEPQTSKAVSVKKQLKKLTKRIVALEQKKFPDSVPPSGPAKGDLAGSYPNPTIAKDVIKPANIPDETLTGYEIAPDSLYANDLASNSVGAAELKATHVVVSPGVSIAQGNIGTATVACPAGELLTGGGHSWQVDATVTTIFSTPVEFADARMWTVRGRPNAGDNTLYAWAVCLPG